VIESMLLQAQRHCSHLRRDESDEAWRLVGEIYAHRVMDGESVALGDATEELLVR
jgi:hypothetical protein